MKKIGNFQTEDDKRLSEQLDRFQEAVDNETQSIRLSYIPQLKPIRVLSSTLGATLLNGQMALCDTNAGNVNIALIPGIDPGWLAVAKRFAANNIVLKPTGSAYGQARRINATTSLTRAAVGLLWIYFDGTDWWA